MLPTHTFTTADAWLQWFDTSQQTACRAFLCTQYHLDALDAEALMNTARFQVFLHWGTINNPLAYFWHTLTRAARKHQQHHTDERRQLAVYAQQHRAHPDHATRTAQQVADLLERVTPRQRHLLEWFMQGYDDTQVAEWLTTTPQAVRVARHGAYQALRAELRPLGHRLSKEGDHHYACHPRKE
jgi:DNA-binding NarL/FixJ family response regulator